jgi:hypothetical protein
MHRNPQHYFHNFFFIVFVVSLFASCSGEKPQVASSIEPYTKSWQAVNKLMDDGLTASAMDTVNSIFKRAKTSGNADQMIKALIYNFRLESYKEEDAFVKTLSRLNAELTDAKFPVAPVLHSMLAECYWHYYNNNRWRFYDRSQTVNLDIKDIRTWDLRTIMEKMTQEYELSIKDANELKKKPLTIYNEVVNNNSAEEKLRPTLYDFLAHRAIDFFSLDDNELTKPSFEFTLNSAEYFQPYDRFVQLDITSRDTASLKFHAILILKDLIAFHLHDASPDALVDVDLKRLAFVRQHSVIENKDSLYLVALQTLEKRFSKSPVSTEVTYQIALLKNSWAQTFVARQDERYRWSNRDALELCRKAIDTYPQSFGAAQCRTLVSEITAKTMGFTTESVCLPGKPFKALFTYKNVKRVFWRQVKIGFNDYQNILRHSYNDSLVIKLTSLKPLKEWSTSVPDPVDYQNHSVELDMPAFSHGNYVILCASDSNFSFVNQAVAYGSVQISRMCYIDRQSHGSGQEFHIVDRETGIPMQGVTVKTWQNVYDQKLREYKPVLHGTFLSDNDGHVVIPVSGNQTYNNFTIECIKDDDHLYSDQQYYLYNYQKPSRTISLRTFFFTDRVIYRPGQTVYFKGIMLRTDGEKSDVVVGQKTKVRFVNTNGQDVTQLTLITNKYGSISGSFVAPVNSLNGQMSIANDNGTISFSVEDYKRPKFEITIDPFKGTSRLGDSIHVTGVAKAYSGASIDGANVKFRVVRTARFPNWWWCWWRPAQWSSEMEINSGNTITNDTGEFSVDFTALADQSIPKAERPTFSYMVTVDVTDITGETRSASGTVNVGYISLSLNIGVDRLVKRKPELSFPLSTANLNGIFEPAQGVVVVYKLKTPEKIFRSRLWSAPDTTLMTQAQHESLFPDDLYDNENDISKWPKADKVYESTFDTKNDRMIKLTNAGRWKPGAYVLEGITKDKFGQEVKDVKYFTLFSDIGNDLPYAQADWFVPVKVQCEPGEKAVFLFGSGYRNTKVLYEIEHKNEIVKSEWLSVNDEQIRLEIPIEEKHRGNVSVQLTFVHSNRSYHHTETVTVPWTNKELDISFETFRSKLVPGEKEEWRMKIAGKNKDKIAAEMVATLFDASLDAFRSHDWSFGIYPYFGPSRPWNTQEIARTQTAQLNAINWNKYQSSPNRNYPSLNWFGYVFESQHSRKVSKSMMAFESSAPPQPSCANSPGAARSRGGLAKGGPPRSGGMKENADEIESEAPKQQDLSNVATRTNLNETAFFFPALETSENGEIIVKFQIPEALTKWRMLGFAHTQDLKFGKISNVLVTQKDLMVVPNPPRFFRENDRITFTAKVSNLSDSAISGSAQLYLFDAATMKPVDAEFKNTTPQVFFNAKNGQSAPLAWDIAIPTGIGAVTFKVVAKANNFSDGEEQIIPVLSNSMLVTESVPLSIRKKETKNFTLPTLVSQNNGSTTLRNYKLTLEFTSNPAWYAIQSLPYLMEYPYECAEQTFARFYANTIAAHIASSSPKIKAVFDQWKTLSPDALLSNMEKNQELKALTLEETPWLLDGKDESERKKRVALLFDLNKLANEKENSLSKLKKSQMDCGAWPWFDGGPDDRYITQYITIGLGRLDHLNMLKLRTDNELLSMTQRSLLYLDNRIRQDYELIQKNGHLDNDNLSESQIQYLYMRSYFKDVDIEINNKTAVEYFLGQSKKFWLQKQRYMQGMIALTLNRNGDLIIPGKIVRSLKENAIVSEEMGMYWKEMYEGYSWWWYQAPIESQALMVEVFDEVAQDTASVEDLKTFLIKSKQTQNWQTTKATAEACYALLLRGANWLEKSSTVSIKLGDVVVDASNVKDTKTEAGTGYFKLSWSGPEIKPNMGNITITKQEAGVSWGSVYWQYFEQLDKIKSHDTPLKLNKKLFIQQASTTGPKIVPIDNNSKLKPGDKLTVRIELRVDRDMEYVHMKDMRAAGFEPLNVFSGYHWQDGLGYYESTRDAATNFFFSVLPKGTYVFEYPLVVTHAGDFSSGVTTIQSMYAPEFTSHSDGARVKVGK